MIRDKQTPLSKQMKDKIAKPVVKNTEEYPDGNFNKVISTGSTLLDLAISGGRVRGGGLPGGIFVEIFGQSQSGKTIFLSEVAGEVQRQGGEIIYYDPEARLDPVFAKMIGLTVNEKNHLYPDTVPEIFAPIKKWQPENSNVINGIFADSLAALSTELEMSEEGDPYGTRRAKEFSEWLRKTCRIVQDKNYLMVCSNQIRQIIGATQYQPKTSTTGGKAMDFYPSLRLVSTVTKKHKVEVKFAGKEVERIVGIRTEVEVYKSSIWKPYHKAPVSIIFDYGVDNTRESLQFIKDYSKFSVYTLGGETLDKSLNESIKIIEDDNLEHQLREEVIDLWTEIESKFDSNRKPKR